MASEKSASQHQSSFLSWLIKETAVYSSATVPPAFVGTFIQYHMVRHIKREPNILRNLLPGALEIMRPYMVWQVRSTSSGILASELFKRYLTTGRVNLDSWLAILAASAAETGLTARSEIFTMMNQAKRQMPEHVRATMFRVAPALFFRNMFFWAGVEAAGRLSEGKSRETAASYSSVAGMLAAFGTMPIVNALGETIDGKYQTVPKAIAEKIRENGIMGVYRGLGHRGALLAAFAYGINCGAEIIKENIAPRLLPQKRFAEQIEDERKKSRVMESPEQQR